jgi:hypothetical protein
VTPGKRTLTQDLPVRMTEAPVSLAGAVERGDEASLSRLNQYGGNAGDWQAGAPAQAVIGDLAAELSETALAGTEPARVPGKQSRVQAELERAPKIALAAGTPRLPWPGDRSTSGAMQPVVQRRATVAAGSSSDPLATAQAGTSAGGRKLPHLDLIQASFGHHDVSGVDAVVGGTAADASVELGANAYAVDNAIGFSTSPDLHLAAHEAAHVVQQRHGFAPSDGVDTPDDAYEQHADAVADAVVAGQSAEALLDEITTGAAAAPAVQRQPAPETPVVYLMTHNESPSRLKAAKVSLYPDDRTLDGIERALLVYYGIPATRVREFDIASLPIATDPAGFTALGPTDAKGGVVFVEVSPKLEEYLRHVAERFAKQSGTGTALAPAPTSPSAGGGQEGQTPQQGGAQQGGGTIKKDPAPKTPSGPDPEGDGPRGDNPHDGSKDGTPDGRGKVESVVIPPRLKPLFPDDKAVVTVLEREAKQKALDELMKLSDEDLSNFVVIASGLTRSWARMLAAIEMYKKLKEQYQQQLEQALIDAAKDQASLVSADLDADGPLDPATFKRMTSAEKEKLARKRMSAARNKALREMVKNLGKAIKEIAKGVVRPDLQVQDVNKAIGDVANSKGGWDTAANTAGAGSKLSGMVGGILAVLAVVAVFAVPGSAAFLMEASLFAMMSSAVLAMSESELFIKAAGDADTTEKFEEYVQGGAEAQLRGFMVIAGMATGVAGTLIGKIPLGARLGTVGEVLSVARATLTKGIGDAWLSSRQKLVTRLRKSMDGLVEMLATESKPALGLKAKLDAMDATKFYEKIVDDPKFAAQLGLTPDGAKNLAALSKAPQSKAPAIELFEQTRSALADGVTLAQKQLAKVKAAIEKNVKALEATRTKEELAKALATAEDELSEPMLGLDMQQEGAQHAAAKLKELMAKAGVKESAPADAKPAAPTTGSIDTRPGATDTKVPAAPAMEAPALAKGELGAVSKKRWDDPSLTEDEFIKDVRAANPRRTETDADLRAAYQAGGRRAPDGKLKVPAPKFKRGAKAWDDPTLDADEAINDYRATAKASLRDQPTDVQIRGKHGQGLRWDPEAAKWKNVTKTARDWESSKTSMAKAERDRRAAAAAPTAKPKRVSAPDSSDFDTHVDGLAQAGKITAEEASVLQRWSRLFGRLVEKGSTLKVGALLKETFGGDGPIAAFVRGAYDKFRLRLIGEVIELSKEADGSYSLAKLKAIAGEGLEVLPDPATRGSLISKWRRQRFLQKGGHIETVTGANPADDPPKQFGLKKEVEAETVTEGVASEAEASGKRFADGTVHVNAPKSKQRPAEYAVDPPEAGDYAADDKAGMSFDQEQLRAVNGMMEKDGIWVGGSFRKGVIYFCDNAENAAFLRNLMDAKKMSRRMRVAQLVDKAVSPDGVIWVR